VFVGFLLGPVVGLLSASSSGALPNCLVEGAIWSRLKRKQFDSKNKALNGNIKCSPSRKEEKCNLSEVS